MKVSWRFYRRFRFFFCAFQIRERPRPATLASCSLLPSIEPGWTPSCTAFLSAPPSPPFFPEAEFPPNFLFPLRFTSNGDEMDYSPLSVCEKLPFFSSLSTFLFPERPVSGGRRSAFHPFFFFVLLSFEPEVLRRSLFSPFISTAPLPSPQHFRLRVFFSRL